MLNEEKVQDRVAIVYGRFQPLTRAHYGMIKSLIDKYQRVFVFPIQGEKAFKVSAKTEKGRASQMAKKLERSPFPAGLRAELIKKSFPSLDSKQILRGERGSISYLYDKIKRMYPNVNIEKLDVWAGPDEYEDYQRQAKEMMEKAEYTGVNVDVKEFDVGTRESVSATKVREAIANPDKEEGFEVYKELVAPPLANRETFDKLRKTLKRLRKLDIEESFNLMLNRIGDQI